MGVIRLHRGIIYKPVEIGSLGPAKDEDIINTILPLEVTKALKSRYGGATLPDFESYRVTSCKVYATILDQLAERKGVPYVIKEISKTILEISSQISNEIPHHMLFKKEAFIKMHQKGMDLQEEYTQLLRNLEEHKVVVNVLNKKCAYLEKKDARLIKNMKEHNEIHKKLKHEVTNLKHLIKKLQKESLESDSKINKAEIEYEDLVKVHNTVNEEVELLKESNKDLQAKLQKFVDFHKEMGKEALEVFKHSKILRSKYSGFNN